MLAKWAEDDRQAKIKEEQRRLKMLEYRELCNKLDLERHKNSISEKVCLSVSMFLCLSVCLWNETPATWNSLPRPRCLFTFKRGRGHRRSAVLCTDENKMTTPAMTRKICVFFFTGLDWSCLTNLDWSRSIQICQILKKNAATECPWMTLRLWGL